jgi:hypothetical protein
LGWFLIGLRGGDGRQFAAISQLEQIDRSIANIEANGT